MKKNILMGKGSEFVEIPGEIWTQHLAQIPQDFRKILSFMTEEHHMIRYFVVKELPHTGKPIPPEFISEELKMSLSKTIKILDELEENLFFLVRDGQGRVSWAFPVTADNTPHHLTFSTGERIDAA